MKALAGRVSAWLSARSDLSLFLGTAVVVVLIGVADHLLDPDLSVVLFYAVPVAVVSWYGRRAGAVSIALLATASGLVTELVLTHGEAVAPFVSWWNAAMRLGTYLIIVVATTRLKQALAIERALGRTDPTTDAANAPAFREAAEREVARVARSGGPLSVAYLDLDDFKLINDGLGHSAGDRVLRRTAEVLMEHARATDVVARLGGDEFVVLLPDTPAVEAVAAAERLRRLVADSVNAGPNVVRASAGVATFVTPPRSVEQLITFADQQMYEAKRLGKDRSEHRIVLEPEAQQASG